MLDHPRREPGLARFPRLQVLGRVETARHLRLEDAAPIDDLDRDVVVADQVAEALRDQPEDGPRLQRGEDRLGDLQQLRLAAELPLECGGLLAQALGRVGVGHRLGGEARIDLEEPKVVLTELAQPELREHEDAEDLVLEEHRGEEHRPDPLPCRRSCSRADRWRHRAGFGRSCAGRPNP